VATFPAGFDPVDPGTRSRSATSRHNPAAAASRITGTSPAADTKFGSSNDASTRESACNNRTSEMPSRPGPMKP
jgi:hypothetical protein